MQVVDLPIAGQSRGAVAQATQGESTTVALALDQDGTLIGSQVPADTYDGGQWLSAPTVVGRWTGTEFYVCGSGVTRNVGRVGRGGRSLLAPSPLRVGLGAKVGERRLDSTVVARCRVEVQSTKDRGHVSLHGFRRDEQLLGDS